MGESSDEVLMARYKDGDTRAFETLLRRHRKPVFNFLLRYTGDRTGAEDLLQEVFLRIIRGAETYEQKSKFTTWLYAIARNLCIDHLRRGQFRQAVSLSQPVGHNPGGDGGERSSMMDLVSDSGSKPEQQAMGSELRAKLQQAITSLKEEQREVFIMREYLGMPFKEIAQVVGCPENTVKSRMRYALEALRTKLEEFADLAQGHPSHAFGTGFLSRR